jgi:signal recognition particle receptor subunit beta
MVVFNYTGRELTGKIVYYGPALSGKTTNLEYIYGHTPSDTRGKMVSMKTKAERTLFFDLLPISRGKIGDFNVRILLYTVPGQVYYNATRKLVLKGADAVVFVADSQRSQLAANIDSLRNLRTNLLEYGMCLDDLPWVITYNKRDMPDAMSIEELERELNPSGVPSFPMVAVSGEGVFESFEKISEMLMARLESQLRGEPAKSEAPPPPPPLPPGPAIDPGAIREVRDAIQSSAPAGAPRPAPAQELVIDRNFDERAPGKKGAAGARPPAAQPAAASSGKPAGQGGATAVSVASTTTQPLVIQRALTIPVPRADLAGGTRTIRVVLDVTIEPRS